MAPRLTRPTATANKSVNAMTLDIEQRTNDLGEKTMPYFNSIAYFPDGKQMIGGSSDNSARRWDLRTGKEIVEARFVCEQEVLAVAVSSDSRWVITGGGDWNGDDLGELKAYEVETGMMKTFQGHSGRVTCIDISMDNKLLASGSWDKTARIWDLNTGKLVAGPFECADMVGAVRFSQDSKKLAVKSGAHGMCLEVWDILEQKLDGRVGEANGSIWPDSPVFWTTKYRSIVTAFRFEDVDESVVLAGPTTIYEFDSSMLETVGAPFEGHNSRITCLALSLDCALLASASEYDDTIKLWAFESRQLLVSFDGHNPRILILSPNSRQLAYAGRDQPKIHVCDIPPDILTRLWPEQATCSVCVLTAYIYHLSTNSSCRPLCLNIRTALTLSTYVILFFHPYLSLILRHYRSLTRLVILLPCAVSKSHGLLLPDRR